MLSEDSLKQISHIFCGDVGEYYIYKSGPKLVDFFNRYYQESDKYGQGFPSRWIYVFNKLVATVYKGNIIKNLIMDCQSYTKYRPNETTGGIFVSWRRKEELPTGA